MGRKKCTTPGCGCFAYVSDLTNRRICTCGHAAGSHESDEWNSPALRAAPGAIRTGVHAGQGRIFAATDLRSSTDRRDFFCAGWPVLGTATRNAGEAAPEK